MVEGKKTINSWQPEFTFHSDGKGKAGCIRETCTTAAQMPLHLTNQNLIKQFPFIDKGVFSNQGGSLTTFS